MIFSRKCSKSSVILHLTSMNCIQYIFISRGLVLFSLCTRNIWKRVQIAILILFNNQLLEKMTPIIKICTKSTLFFFNIKIRISCPVSRNLHNWPHYLFHFSKMQAIFNWSALYSFRTWYLNFFIACWIFNVQNNAF